VNNGYMASNMLIHLIYKTTHDLEKQELLSRKKKKQLRSMSEHVLKEYIFIYVYIYIYIYIYTYIYIYIYKQKE
jgi:hypothetical protein